MSIEQKIAQILAESKVLLESDAQGQGQGMGMGISPYDPSLGIPGIPGDNTLAQYSDPSVNVPIQPVDTGSVPGMVNPAMGQLGVSGGQPIGQDPSMQHAQVPAQAPVDPNQMPPTSDNEEEDEEDDDDKKGDEEDEDEIKKNAIPGTKVESVDVSADVNALVEGENLTPEFKEKAGVIFEAAVLNRVRSEVSKIEESYNVHLNKEIEKLKEGLVDKVDGYLDYVVEQWFEQNEIALESGMKTEIVEGFIYGLKNLFEEHYIDVPEEKFDVMESLEKQVEELKTRLNEQVETTVKLRNTLNEAKSKEIVNELAKGLTETDKEKFKTLTEDLTFDTPESYKKKVQTVRESYFKNNAPVANPATSYIINNEPIQLTEDKVYPSSMKNYLSALDKLIK